MSLIKCPECGKEFSSYSSECPVCGMPTAKMEVNISKETNEVIEEPQKKQVTKKKFFTTEVIVKIICSVAVFIGLNIFLLDETLSVSFGGLLLLNAVISYAVGFVVLDFKWAFTILLAGMFVLMMFHKIIPTIDVINSDESHDKRYVIYFMTKTPTGDIEGLAPTGDYIYNRTGRTLYLTTVGYGEYMDEPSQYATIPNNSVVKGDVYEYFKAPEHQTWVRSRGRVKGIRRSYLDYSKH